MSLASKFKEKYLKELNAPNDAEQVAQKLEIPNQGITGQKRGIKIHSPRSKLVLGISSLLVIGLSIAAVFMVIDFRNTPVYEGMFVSSNDSLSIDIEGRLLAAVSDEFIDEIESTIDVEFFEGISYYAEKNETIIVTVQISNPQFFEILSFTLNGRLYQTFEFLEGSNSEQIIVNFQVQDASGLQEITIDAIKYVDDTTIKNARFDADRTIKIGVLYENAPAVTNVSELIQATTFGVSFVVTDTNGLIELATGLNMYVFDGVQIIHKIPLILGTNVIPISNLRMGSDYQYAIVGVFDLMDGLGKKSMMLHQNSFKTKNGFEISSLTTDYDSLSVEVSPYDLANGQIDKAEVFLDDQLIETLTTPGLIFSFNGLLSNREYKMVVTYSYEITENGALISLQDTIESTTSTVLRPDPTVVLTEVSHTQDAITYQTEIQDTTDVGMVTQVSLFIGDTLIQTHDSLVLSFTNLLSNTEYRIQLTYQYDLLDGQGSKTMSEELMVTTDAKQVPTLSISLDDITQDAIDFSYAFNDPDQIASVSHIELMKDDNLISTVNDLNQLNFSGLLSSNTYDIRVHYVYDLNDGQSELSNFTEQSFTTLAKTIPVMRFTDAIIFVNTLTAWFRVEDIDQVGTIVRFDLYKDGLFVSSVTEGYLINVSQTEAGVSTGSVSFTVSGSGSYQVVIIYTYDLLDGEGLITIDETTIGADNKILFVQP